MVNIIYGEHSQQVELAGKTVADAREMFESEFDLSDRAQANLNGQWLKRKLESETGLCDDDEVYFEERSRRGLVMLGAFLLTLAITGGLFAYTATTRSVTIGVTSAGTDFANVTANNTPSIAYTLLGRHRGTIDPNTLFNISTATTSPDIEVQVYLANPDELSSDYSFWTMRLALRDSANVSMDMDGITQILSLDNPVVIFTSDNTTPYNSYVHNLGGSYRTFPSGWLNASEPLIFCKVVQRSP
jgi:hypothetical protein